MDAITTNHTPDVSMDMERPDDSRQSEPVSPTSVLRRASSVPTVIKSSHESNIGYVYSARMLVHASQFPQGHPEQPDRLRRIWYALRDGDCFERMKRIPERLVERDEILLIHSQDHWDKVMALQYLTTQEIIDSEAYYEHLSLYVMPSTPYAARLSCGGAVDACLAVAENKLKKSFAIVRPPGHHAEPEEHMGFCFFNNVAVAARVVQAKTSVKRILILDWDVHHGNGTQRAFYDDPSVLYISLHRYEQGQFYPCGPFGSMESCGEGAGCGFSVNIPWPEKGMGDADYIHAFQRIVMPIAIEFAPELVIISAGFDAAEGDELGECHVTPAGYAHMTHMLSGLAGGRVAVALEGGYNLDSISKSALAVTQILLGHAPPELPPMVATEAGTETVWLVAKEQSKYWKSMDPKACEPKEDNERTTFSIPEILKGHRQNYLYSKYDMYQIPLADPAIEERYGTQVMCTSDIFEKSTMVVIVHEFGNLRAEFQDAITCDVRLEKSYLIDFSKELVAWVRQQGHSLIDVNLYPKPFASSPARGDTYETAKDIMTYLWDNYIQLSGAARIVLIGHGPGCQPVMELLKQRTSGILQSVQAVVQVVGMLKIPAVPRYPEALRPWHSKNCMVVLPTNHPQSESTVLKNYGPVVPLEESRAVRLITLAFPAICEFLDSRLDTLQTTTSHLTDLTLSQEIA